MIHEYTYLRQSVTREISELLTTLNVIQRVIISRSIVGIQDIELNFDVFVHLVCVACMYVLYVCLSVRVCLCL